MTPPDVLVDSCVLLDIATLDKKWAAWSTAALTRAAETSRLVINPVIYAEVLQAFTKREELDHVLPSTWVERRAIPWEASLLATKYLLKRTPTARRAALSDLYVGAHALVEGLTLLTREPRRYSVHFRALTMIAP